jgi:hypothetical protein
MKERKEKENYVICPTSSIYNPCYIINSPCCFCGTSLPSRLIWFVLL